MIPIIWTAEAREDVEEILDYISDENPAAAERLRVRFETVVLPLSEFPLMYPESQRMPSCREIVAHSNYLVFYHVARDHIEVVNVVHGRRNFPLST